MVLTQDKKPILDKIADTRTHALYVLCVIVKTTSRSASWEETCF